MEVEVNAATTRRIRSSQVAGDTEKQQYHRVNNQCVETALTLIIPTIDSARKHL